MVLFCSAPPFEYPDPSTYDYDNTDLSDFTLPSGNVIPIVDRAKAKCLGSIISRDGTGRLDVEVRVVGASRAFGSLSKLVFRSMAVSLAAKREAYVALILVILMYGCECWCLMADLWGKLRRLHHPCVRAICRVMMWHTRKHHITTASILKLSKIRSIETHVRRRQLQWMGHVARMQEHRLLRKLLSSWCGGPGPQRRPGLTYGKGIGAAREYAGVDGGVSWSWRKTEGHGSR